MKKEKSQGKAKNIVVENLSKNDDEDVLKRYKDIIIIIVLLSIMIVMNLPVNPYETTLNDRFSNCICIAYLPMVCMLLLKLTNRVNNEEDNFNFRRRKIEYKVKARNAEPSCIAILAIGMYIILLFIIIMAFLLRIFPEVINKMYSIMTSTISGISQTIETILLNQETHSSME